jgi:hypothetical protein
MTTEKLLEKLRNQLESLGNAIHYIEQIQTGELHEVKRKSIIRSVKRSHHKKITPPKPKRSYNGKHWTQTPEGKKRLSRNGRKMWKSRRLAEDPNA